MRKFTLIVSALLYSFMADAQSLGAVSPSPSPMSGPSNVELDATVGILNSSANPVSVKVMRYRNLAPGHKSYYCWYIECYADTVNMSPDSVMIDVDSTDWSFHGKLDPQGFDGISTVRFNFFDMYNPNDSLSITWIYDFTLGISGPGTSLAFPLSEASPNPANNLTSVNYNVPDGSNARLVIYDMLGKVVKETRLNGKQGTLIVVTSDLRQGVYYYSLVAGDKIIATKKLVVAHR